MNTAIFYIILIGFYTVTQFILFTIIYFTVRKNQHDLYHTLYSEKEKQEKEDLENQRKKITEIYKTQLDIRQTKQAVEQASFSEHIDKEKIKEILDRLQEDYTSTNLATVADLESKQGNFEKALEYINKAIELDFENPELWRIKSTLFNNLGRTAEEQEAKTRYIEFLGNANFKKNLKQKITLQEIEFKNFPFFGSFVWKLKPKINILLGKNGYGKSHLLSIALAQLQEETTTLLELSRINTMVADQSFEKSFIRIKIDNEESIKKDEIVSLQKEIIDLNNQKVKIEALLSNTNSSILKESTDNVQIETDHKKLLKELESKFEKIGQLAGQSLFDKAATIQSTFGKIPVLAIPDIRFVNKSTVSTSVINDEKAKKLLEFGAYHFINQVPYENAIQNFLNTICNIYYNDSKTFKDEIFQLVNRVFIELTGNEFKWQKIYPTQDNSSNVIKVETDGNNESLPIQKVSQGTLSVLSIVGLIFHYLSLKYPDVKRTDLAKEQAIVFIDEIDAHLHPSWQQKLIGILRREFPNIQFIITAHSPLIVAGCKEDEVAVMRVMKSNDGKFVKGFFVETLFEDFIGYPIDELYKKVFDIENKDENYLKYVSLIPGKSEIEAEVKKLEEERDKGVLSPNDQFKLTELYDDLYYIEKAKERMDSTVDVEKIKMQNQMLKMELEIEKSNLSSK
jgi:predicted ATP-binding protein involved in virulence